MVLYMKCQKPCIIGRWNICHLLHLIWDAWESASWGESASVNEGVREGTSVNGGVREGTVECVGMGTGRGGDDDGVALREVGGSETR